MKNTYRLFVVLSLGLFSCQSKPGDKAKIDTSEVNNPGSRYVDSLRQDVSKAEEAADKYSATLKRHRQQADGAK
jgi:hypothetical protein